MMMRNNKKKKGLMEGPSIACKLGNPIQNQLVNMRGMDKICLIIRHGTPNEKMKRFSVSFNLWFKNLIGKVPSVDAAVIISSSQVKLQFDFTFVWVRLPLHQVFS